MVLNICYNYPQRIFIQNSMFVMDLYNIFKIGVKIQLILPYFYNLSMMVNIITLFHHHTRMSITLLNALNLIFHFLPQ